MQRSKVSWSSKLRPDMEPKDVADPRGRGLMLVPTPLIVAEELSKVEPGRLTTPSRIRSRLAERFKADRTCPLTTGIFLNILAGAAEEQMARGESPIAPYWRVVAEDGSLRGKNPLGLEQQARRLEEEGVEISRRANLAVPQHEKRLV